MSKYKKLLGNSLIFAVGNLGSKLLVILLVPLYTRYLSTGEYGMVDLVTTTTNMLAPILSLSTYDAVLRYVLDKKYNDDVILSNGLIITVIGALFSVVLLLFDIAYAEYLCIILVLQSFQTLFSHYARGIGRVKLYAVNGLLHTLVTSVFTVLFLVTMAMGIDGYFLAIIFATLFSILFLFFTMRLYRVFKIKKMELPIIKKMLTYSLPLIPNSFAWWLNNASSRYFILFFLGVSTNGLFAVANKIPALLTMLNNIFFQSWQLSAVEEYESKQNKDFYTEVFLNYSQMIFLANAFLLAILKPLMHTFVSAEFYDSWLYIPPLLLATIYASFSSFLGTTYIAAKKTKGVLVTTIIGAVLNVVFNFLLIPLVGGVGAGIASSISFLVIWLIRQKDTKQFVDIAINKKNMLLNHGLLIIQMLLVYQTDDVQLYIGQALAVAAMCVVNLSFIKNIRFLLPRRAGDPTGSE